MFVSCGNRSNVPIWSLALFSPMPLQSPVIWSPKSSKPVIIIQFELFCAFKRKSPECKEETFCVCFVEMLCNKTWEILSLDRRKYFPWVGGNPWAVGGWGWGTKSSHGPTPLHCHHIYKTLATCYKIETAGITDSYKIKWGFFTRNSMSEPVCDWRLWSDY